MFPGIYLLLQYTILGVIIVHNSLSVVAIFFLFLQHFNIISLISNFSYYVISLLFSVFSKALSILLSFSKIALCFTDIFLFHRYLCKWNKNICSCQNLLTNVYSSFSCQNLEATHMSLIWRINNQIVLSI